MDAARPGSERTELPLAREGLSAPSPERPALARLGNRGRSVRSHRATPSTSADPAAESGRPPTSSPTTPPARTRSRSPTTVRPAGRPSARIAVFARNNDTDQSIIFASTGDGNIGGTGVGFLRSMDGGKTWHVLDSSTNFDANGNLLPLNSASRDHIFVGTTSYKMIVDPKLSSTGDVIVYAALANGSSNNEGGVWRSSDSGKTWQRIAPATSPTSRSTTTRRRSPASTRTTSRSTETSRSSTPASRATASTLRQTAGRLGT